MGQWTAETGDNWAVMNIHYRVSYKHMPLTFVLVLLSACYVYELHMYCNML